MPAARIDHELKQLLSGISAKYADRYEEAVQAFASRKPENLRQSMVSMRELLKELVDEVGGGETRKASVKSIIGPGAEARLADAVASVVIELHGALSTGVHSSLTYESTFYGFRICEYTLRYLLKSHERMKLERSSIEIWSRRYPDRNRGRRNKHIVEKFQEFLGQPIQNLIEHGGTTLAKGRLRSSQDIAQKLSKYRQFLTSHNTAETSVTAYEDIIRSYIGFLGLKLQPAGDIVRHRSQYESYYLLTQEQVKTMVAKARRPRWKALIAFLAQTGQKTSVLLSLQNGMIEEFDGHGVVSVPWKSENRQENTLGGKAGYQFVIPKDTMKLIKKLPPATSSEYIFRYSHDGVWSVVTQVAKECGYQGQTRRKTGGITSKIHPETLRRYFVDRMKEAEVNDLLVRYMTGYVVPSIARENYQQDRLLQSIQKAEDRGIIDVL